MNYVCRAIEQDPIMRDGSVVILQPESADSGTGEDDGLIKIHMCTLLIPASLKVGTLCEVVHQTEEKSREEEGH